jgi:hypothetical protein
MATNKTIEELIKLSLRYEPETGELYWRERPVESFQAGRKFGKPQKAAIWNGSYAGKRAFTSVNARGYRHGKLNGKDLTLHRVAFILQTGQWPKECVDHINGAKLDNRWSNLREASRAQNTWNARGYSKTSPYVGVSWNTRARIFIASIRKDGKYYYIGRSKDPEVLARKRDKFAKEFYGEYARLNFNE